MPAGGGEKALGPGGGLRSARHPALAPYLASSSERCQVIALGQGEEVVFGGLLQLFVEGSQALLAELVSGVKEFIAV